MDINLWKLVISDFKFDKPPSLSYHKGPVVIYRGEFPRYREELRGDHSVMVRQIVGLSNLKRSCSMMMHFMTEIYAHNS